MIKPSTNDENPKNWKCKLFGCRDEWLPLTYYEQKERHGITGGFSFATAANIAARAFVNGLIVSGEPRNKPTALAVGH